MKYKRIPRKKKKTIPKDSIYCSSEYTAKGKFVPCAFRIFNNEFGYGDCKLRHDKNGSNDDTFDICLDDGVKSCGLKEPNHYN